MSKLPLAALFSSTFARFAATSVSVLVVAVIAVLVFQPFFGVKVAYAYDNFTLTAEQSDTAGVAPNSTYLLESKQPVKAADVEKLLTVNGAGTPNLDQLNDKQIRISFEQPLDAAKVVQFQLDSTTTDGSGQSVDRPYAWAFQVKSTFRVTDTLPGKEASNVALDSGIEVNFSYDNVDADAFQKAITITPAVTGHVEHLRRSFVFVPDKLEPATVYTVTIAGSLGLTGSDETLGGDYTYQFQTATTDDLPYFSFNKELTATTPDGSVALPFNSYSRDTAPSTLHVKLYAFAGQTAFQDFSSALETAHAKSWQQYMTADDLANTTSMPVAQEFDATPVQVDYQSYLIFPKSVPAGYYLIDATYGGGRDWLFLESSNMTAYVTKAVDRTLVWANDASTHGPIAGATVSLVGFDTTGTTDATGVGYVPVQQNQSTGAYLNADFVQVTHGTDAILMPLQTNVRPFAPTGADAALVGPYRQPGTDMWTYFYTDRPMYQPTDTVKFWGYAENRLTGARPDSVRVWLGIDNSCEYLYGDCGYQASNVEYAETTLSVGADGTFTGEVPFSDVSPGYYSLYVEANGVTIESGSVQIQEYVKPAYTLSVTPDKDAAFVDDMVGFTVHGEYFDGTPTKGLQVNASLDGNNTQTLTLDDAGNARGSVTIPEPNEGNYQYYPTSSTIEAVPTHPEEGDISAQTSVKVFGPHVYLDVPWDQAKIVNGKGTVTVTARNIQAIAAYDPETFAPTARANQLVTGQLIEETYTPVENGAYYDFVQKKVVKTYYYKDVQTTIDAFSLTTGTDGTATYTFDARNPDANYRVKFSATDELGRVATQDVNVWRDGQTFRSSGGDEIDFLNLDAPPDGSAFAGYAVKDTVHLEVEQNDKRFVPPSGSTFLYFQAQQGIQEATISTQPEYDFSFEQRDVPNVLAYGVMFTGEAYQRLGASFSGYYGGWGGTYVPFDESQNRLTIDLTPDKQAYRPGDPASVAVHVTDKDGNPVAADVNLNVVDEAFYALAPEQVDPLGALYQRLDDGILSMEVSEEKLSLPAFEGGGGGGGDQGRALFRDTAAFAVIQTDASGNATYAFTLPDNITSWRVTAQALQTGRKLAGTEQIDLPATQPYFVQPVMKDSYLATDQPTILLRSAGSQIGLGDAVSYEIKVPDAQVDVTKNGTASQTVDFDLPSLSLGSHTVTITGTDGSLTDTITRTVDIVPSRLVRPVIESTPLAAGTTIRGSSDGTTLVSLLDGDRGTFYFPLLSLSRSYGDRADEIAARVAATKMLNDAFGESNAIPDVSASTYQQYDGVKLLPNGDVDFDLTAELGLLKDSPFDGQTIVSAIQSKLNEDPTTKTPLTSREVAEAYAALAAQGQPVLGVVQRFAALPNLGTDEKLYAALALHFSGDDEGARAIYNDLAAGLTTDLGYAYLPSDTKETSAEQTSLMAVLAGALREPQRDQLEGYVSSQDVGQTTLVAQQVLYIQETLPTLPEGAVQVAYTINGQRTHTTLDHGKSLTLGLSPDALAALDPVAEKGNVIAVSRYDAPLLDQSAPTDSRLGAVRTYSVNATPGTTFNAGDLVRITITYTVPPSGRTISPSTGVTTTPTPAVSDWFDVTDVLPSGLTPVSIPGSFYYEAQGCVDFPVSVENQRVSFLVDNDTVVDNQCGTNTLTYYARVVTPGIYDAEPVYIRSVNDPNTANHSDAATVTIKP